MNKASLKTRTIKVDALARVEGEGALYVRVKGDTIEEFQFRIFEPPRFFEALLQGRRYSDVPDITARICGICPIAYMLGASQALEAALGVTLPEPLKNLRRLIYCGEWIESHTLHAYLLHAPDFLGLEDAIQLGRQQPQVVEKGLRLKKLGNRILEVIGGRAVHPVNLKVGGFYRAPSKQAIRALCGELQWAIEASLDTLKLFAGFNFPDYNVDYTCISLHHPDHYPITEGRLVSNRGLDIPVDELLSHIDETHVAHSNALQGHLKNGEPYLTGPLARYNNNYHQLSELAREAAQEGGLTSCCTNPFQSILIRAVEVLYACEDALRLAKVYEEPDSPALNIIPQAGEGHGCTEAPRGICYHRYRLDEEGRVLDALIVPPTSQNQKQIEQDLRGVVEQNLHLADKDLKWRCEQTIRNYDPCISCATHFLAFDIDRD
jgi:coenzyme F420-reducing hydrogenase alpha subunit